MPSPLTAPVLGFAAKLRFPTLFKVTAGLLLLNLLWPDPIPFLDEIVMALVALVLANWRRPEPAPAPPPARDAVTIEGESRRE
jgi:hypothetical protein